MSGPIITAIITTIITTAISYLIAPKPKAPRFSSQDEAKGVTVNKDSNNNPIPIVYGKRQLGIIRTFVESSGTDNQYLYVAGVLCEGGGAGITAIDEVYVDDKLVTFDGSLTNGTLRGVSSSDTNFYKNGESLISIQPFFGLDNQSASSLLDETTNWTSNHKLSGLAYVALRFKWNQDAFNGLPEVRVTVRGKKVYDPRLDSTKGGSGSHRQNITSTWAYSANSSLVLLDYLRNTRYGKGLPDDAFETNYDSFKTSANTCDTQVTPYVGATNTLNGTIDNAVTSIVLTDASSFPVSGTILIDSEKITYTSKSINTLTGCTRGANSTTASSHTTGATVDEIVSDINLFETNGVIDSEKKVLENVRELLVPMRAIFNYTQGKYKVIIEGTGSSQLLLTKDNVVSEVKLQGENKSEKYNRVIGTYVNPSKDYQSDTVSYPPFNDSALDPADQHATMLSDDNNTLLERSFDMLQVTSPYQAEEICENILKRSRNNLKAEVTVTSEALNLSIGDIVTATYDTAGFSAKPFRVMSLAINSDSTVTLGLEEHQDNFYTWESKSQVPTIADTILPNPFSVQAPAIVVTDEVVELFDGSVVSKLIVAITNNDSFADTFEVEYKQSTQSIYRLMGRGINQNIELYPVKEGATYNIRARTINTLGVRSAFTTANHEVVTAFNPPADVTNYSIDVVGDQLHHFFSEVTDLDLNFYEIRFTTNVNETQYSNTSVLVKRVARPATSVITPFLGKGKYFIKAVDKFGIRSLNANSVVIEKKLFQGYETIQTITEEGSFSGVKTDCVFIDSQLVLNTANFDSQVGNFDDAVGLFDGGNNTVVSTGTYEFANAFDFNDTFRFSIILNELVVNHIDYVDNFDSQAGEFDDVEGLFDGSTSEAISTNVELQIATSSDNITFSNFSNFKSGDYITRAVKFRAILTSSDTSASPAITNLSLKFLLAKVIQDGSNLVSGTNTSGFPVTFTKAFYQTPSLTIIGQNLNSGDRFILNSKNRSSFNIEFLDSGGNTVSRTFDYQAVGVGSQE